MILTAKSRIGGGTRYLISAFWRLISELVMLPVSHWLSVGHKVVAQPV
jgi:hypothetical protein